jgi:hypothetical protein
VTGAEDPHERGLAAAYAAVDKLPLRNFDSPGGELDILRKHEGARAAIFAYLSAAGVAHGGFIVANAEETKFRCWDQGGSAWTDDREMATRYARREDAEAVHAEDEDAWKILPVLLSPSLAERCTIINRGTANPLIEIPEDVLLDWFRSIADARGFSDRGLNAVQVTLDSKPGQFFNDVPRVVFMVSNIPNSRERAGSKPRKVL